MGLDELITLAQFFPTEEDLDWKFFDGSFSEDLDVLYLYGFTPHIEALIEWLDQDKKRELVFLEDRIAMLKRLEEGEALSVLSHPQVHLKFYLGDVPLEEFVSEVVRGFPFEKVDALFLHDNEEQFQEMKILLLRKSTLEFALHLEMLYGQRLAKNLIRNFNRLPDAFQFGLWKGRFSGIPAIICGAGPSLEAATKELKGMDEKGLIFACGSAIAALSNSLVRPHLLFAIDPNREEFTRLAFQTAFDVPLIFGARLEPNVFRGHAGQVGYVVTGTGGALEKWVEEKLGIEDHEILKGLGEEALSVTSIAFMAALYMGCNPIILAGVDLSYDGEKRYAPGVDVGKTEQKDRLMNTKWIMERDVLDQVALHHPETTFMKTSPKGLQFKNIPYEKDWAQKIVRKQNLRDEIFELSMNTRLSFSVDEVEEVLDQFFTSMKKCRDLVAAIVEELKTIYPNLEGAETTQKAALLEMDLEDEIGFQVSLKQAVYALTFHVRRDHRPTTLPRNLYLVKIGVYIRLQQVIDEYLKLC